MIPDRPGVVLALGSAPPSTEMGNDLGIVPPTVVQGLTAGASLLQGKGLMTEVSGGGRWVQLTAESTAALDALGPTHDGSGAVLGVLRSGGGRFDHVMRFERLGGLPAEPTALLTMIAIQATLKRIEQALQDVATKLDLLLEHSKLEVESDLAGALHTIRHIERLVAEHGEVLEGDWTQLSGVQGTVARAYHLSSRWLDPLRDFLAADETSQRQRVAELDRQMNERDIDTWLRLMVFADMAMRRWEMLFLLHQLTAAPHRVASESTHLEAQANERRADLQSLLRGLNDLLDADPDADLRWWEKAQLVDRYRMGRLRRHLAMVVNAYAEALEHAQVEVPEYVDPRPGLGTQVSDLADEVTARVATGASVALEAGGAAISAAGGWLAKRFAREEDEQPDPTDRPA